MAQVLDSSAAARPRKDCKVFCCLAHSQVARHIRSADRRVLLASPGVSIEVADAILEFAGRPGTVPPVVVLDCNDDVCRLGYGDVKAIRALYDGHVSVRQSPGLRAGALVCDGRGWSFTPTPLAVEDERTTDETPNAIELIRPQLDALVRSMQDEGPMSILGEGLGQIGTSPLQRTELMETEKSLEVAPPIRFDLQRQVRVFQPYIQYVELNLTGCTISRHTVAIPPMILRLASDRSVEERLRTTYRLIGQTSRISDKGLQTELESIRNVFTRPLGKPWGRVMLRSQRAKLDKRLDRFREELDRFRKDVERKLQAEINRSIKHLTKTLLPIVRQRPPEVLLAEIPGEAPTREQAERWLAHVLRETFPTPAEVVRQMEMECVFKDVTYDTLTEPGLKAALKKAYRCVDWDKPFTEFDAAKAR